MNSSPAKREACPACGGNGFVTTVPGPRVRRRHATPVSKVPRPSEAEQTAREEVVIIARAFRDALGERMIPIKSSLAYRERLARGLLAAIDISTSVPLSELVGISHDLHWPSGGVDPCAKPVENIPWEAYDAVIRQFSPAYRAAALLESREGRETIANLCAQLAKAWEYDDFLTRCSVYLLDSRNAP